jgi:amidophosphoribosyltransferase
MCGVVGITSNTAVAPRLVIALFAMQHRGQDAAGIATRDGRLVTLSKASGTVDQALPAKTVRTHAGHSGIGHVRYPTHGSNSAAEAHPFITRMGGIAVAHNGNLTNTDALLHRVHALDLMPLSRNDGELMLLLLAHALASRGGAQSDAVVVEALTEVMQVVEGAYTVVVSLQVAGVDTVLCFRDPHGIRPAVYGKRGNDWAVASESVALDALGASMVSDVPGGSAIFLRHNQEPKTYTIVSRPSRACSFENVYFARPDSRIEMQRVTATRWSMGDILAQEWALRGFQADVIVPIPDTSRPAAQAMSERLGIPHREGFIKNRYSGRTFIMPDATTRDAALRLKLNPIREVFEGKSVLLVDDSVVRGSTMRRIAALVLSLGPKEIHLAVCSPPVRHPCFYGIDMPTKEELIANTVGPDGLESTLRSHFGVDSVTYLSRQGLAKAVGKPLCAACFDGDYPVPLNDHERELIQRNRRPDHGDVPQ